LPPVSVQASGSPLASTRRWCFEPVLALSTGLGPVAEPPFRLHVARAGHRPRPLDLARSAQLGQEERVQPLPHPRPQSGYRQQATFSLSSPVPRASLAVSAAALLRTSLAPRSAPSRYVWTRGSRRSAPYRLWPRTGVADASCHSGTKGAVGSRPLPMAPLYLGSPWRSAAERFRASSLGFDMAGCRHDPSRTGHCAHRLGLARRTHRTQARASVGRSSHERAGKPDLVGPARPLACRTTS